MIVNSDGLQERVKGIYGVCMPNDDNDDYNTVYFLFFFLLVISC